jgi:hypothetical protein
MVARDDERLSVVQLTASVKERIDEVHESLEHVRVACEAATEAARIAERGAKGSSKTLRTKVEALCALKRTKLAQVDALEALRREYECATTTEFDFEEYLTLKTKHYESRRSQELEHLIAFDEAVRGASGDALDADLVLDEEDGTTGARNAKCPITMKRIEALDEPVEDMMGFIYEKDAIMKYIGSKRSVDCPEAGTTHKVSKADLKVSRTALKMKQRAEGMAEDDSGELLSP